MGIRSQMVGITDDRRGREKMRVTTILEYIGIPESKLEVLMMMMDLPADAEKRELLLDILPTLYEYSSEERKDIYRTVYRENSAYSYLM